MNTALLNLLLHTLVTFSMTGIIWFVDLIHYPVIQSLDEKNKKIFEKKHWEKTMKLAVPMLIIELITAVVLILCLPKNTTIVLPLIGLLLLLPIWTMTWGMCVPSHCLLKESYSDTSFTKLTRANRGRAIIWSVRSILIFTILLKAFQ